MATIASTLGVGSGIDTTSLIEQLTTAARAPKDEALTRRAETNTARISALARASSGIDGFANALSTLIGSGTLYTQPTSSDTAVLTATAAAGARIGGLSAQIEVSQLAQAQSLVSEHLTDINAAVGQGTLTITTASGSFDVTINEANDNLVGFARAINQAGAGVTASIVEDSAGARLVLKSGTGAAKAFTLSVSADAQAGLSRFAYDPNVAGGMTRAQAAQDALIKLDGVSISRSTNSISDLISGITIDLKAAKPGTSISLGASRPTAALKQAVGDFVAAFNELKAVLDETTADGSNGGDAGPLRGDSGVRELKRQLAGLTATRLSSAGSIGTLADIGVRTERDGTLTLDSARLDAVLASDPDGVEALFNPGQTSSSPLVTITSPMGRVKPGTYALADLVASSGGTAATGKIGGVDAISAGARLVAATASPAKGLVIELAGNVVSATVTVDVGLGGALQAIRDALLANNGPIKSAQSRLASEAKVITADRARLETRMTSYHDQLVRSFSVMDKQVSAYKATQSYLDQQIEIWTNGND